MRMAVNYCHINRQHRILVEAIDRVFMAGHLNYAEFCQCLDNCLMAYRAVCKKTHERAKGVAHV